MNAANTLEALRLPPGTEGQTREPDPATKPIKLEWLDLPDFTCLPRRRWLMERRFIRGYVTATVAPGGEGKSTLALEEAIALAMGEPRTGLKICERTNVWLYNGEDPLEELQRRAAAICLEYGFDGGELKGRLAVHSGIGGARFTVAALKNGSRVVMPHVDQIIEEINANEIGLLVVDPFVMAHGLGENDNGDIDFAVRQFTRIASQTNCAVHLVHHTRKPPAGDSTGHVGNADSARGAGAFVAACRVVHTLYGFSREDAARYNIPEADRYRFSRLDDAKQNLAPRSGDPIAFYEKRGRVLPNGGSGSDGDEIGILRHIDMEDARTALANRAEQEAAELKRNIASVLAEGEELSANALVGRLIERGLTMGMGKTALRARCESVVPFAPEDARLYVGDVAVQLFRLRDGSGATSPIKFKLARLP